MVYLTFAEFADRCGVTRAAITRAAKTGALCPAVIGEGSSRKINADHPVSVKYIAKHRGEATGELPRTAKGGRSIDGDPDSGQLKADETLDAEEILRAEFGGAQNVKNLAQYLDMPLRDTIDKFKGGGPFKSYADGAVQAQREHKLRLENDVKRGKLVERWVFENHIYPEIDKCFRKMQTDAAKYISRQALSLIKSGDGETEIKNLIIDQNEQAIRYAKQKVLHALRPAILSAKAAGECVPVHKWLHPEIGDSALVCEQCEFESPLIDLSASDLAGIVRGRYLTGDGRDASKFKTALLGALYHALHENLPDEIEREHLAIEFVKACVAGEFKPEQDGVS